MFLPIPAGVLLEDSFAAGDGKSLKLLEAELGSNPIWESLNDLRNRRPAVGSDPILRNPPLHIHHPGRHHILIQMRHDPQRSDKHERDNHYPERQG
jgi:hypothetical protein